MPYDAKVFIQATRVKTDSELSGDTYDSPQHEVLRGGIFLYASTSLTSTDSNTT
ncbi:hypothetical protein PENSUB_11216 [Penicillium subrubescens]|uniref:Uncharacterized protein n=1 Tax=Penicillium subrubescens TaxID=1316194 RepID=A0A1Q5T640_9EURO|nr:hypothetical protein PENSUB_11216 [Penicillium subrubescens]